MTLTCKSLINLIDLISKTAQNLVISIAKSCLLLKKQIN